jgi:hypothetical protein
VDLWMCKTPSTCMLTSLFVVNHRTNRSTCDRLTCHTNRQDDDDDEYSLTSNHRCSMCRL